MQPFPKVRVCVPSGSAAAQTLAHGEKRALKSSQVGELPGTCPAIHLGCELEHVPSPRCACGNAGGEGVSVTTCASPTSAEKSIPLPILYEKYCDYLTESNLIKVQGLLVQQVDNKYLLAERDIYLENPEIKIRVSGGLGRAGGRAGSRGQPRAGSGLASCTCIPARSSSLTPQGSSNSAFIQEQHRGAKTIWDL